MEESALFTPPFDNIMILQSKFIINMCEVYSIFNIFIISNLNDNDFILFFDKITIEGAQNEFINLILNLLINLKYLNNFIFLLKILISKFNNFHLFINEKYFENLNEIQKILFLNILIKNNLKNILIDKIENLIKKFFNLNNITEFLMKYI